MLNSSWDLDKLAIPPVKTGIFNFDTRGKSTTGTSNMEEIYKLPSLKRPL